MLGDGVGIGQHQGFGIANAAAAGVVVARHHKQHVGPQAAELIFGQVLGALAHTHQGDYRGIANDDAQHRQQRAQAVGPERAQGHSDGFTER